MRLGAQIGRGVDRNNSGPVEPGGKTADLVRAEYRSLLDDQAGTQRDTMQTLRAHVDADELRTHYPAARRVNSTRSS